MPVTKRAHQSKANIAIKATIDAITKALQRGETVQIKGFGTFKPVTRKGYVNTVRYKYKGNLISQPFILPERKIIKFTPSKALRDFVSLPLREEEENGN